MKNRYSEIFKDHVMLIKKAQGASKELTGDIVVIVFYINDAESHWTESDIEKYKATHTDAMNSLMKQAKECGADLTIRTASCTLDVDMVCTVDNTEQWIGEALGGYRKTKAADYQQYYEAKYGYDEAPIIFAFNKKFRCYALSANVYYPYTDEYSAVCRDSTAGTIMHELLHQFGANDYYYPADVVEAADKYMAATVMRSSSYTKVDELSKYIIGWTNEISDTAALFLLNTQHHTVSSLEEATRAEWKKWK